MGSLGSPPAFLHCPTPRPVLPSALAFCFLTRGQWLRQVRVGPQASASSWLGGMALPNLSVDLAGSGLEVWACFFIYFLHSL